MTQTKDFDLGDILSIITRINLSRRKMQGITDILTWMTGEDRLEWWQLSRCAEEARIVLRRLYPQLFEITLPSDIPDASLRWLDWLDSLAAQYGQALAVPQMTEAEHTRIDAQEEFTAITESKIRQREGKLHS